MDLESITTLSRAVVRQHGRGLDVVTVTTTGGDSERVEVLITIRGCHSDPCRFMLNVSRADAGEFDREFRGKLTEALHKHALGGSPSE